MDEESERLGLNIKQDRDWVFSAFNSAKYFIIKNNVIIKFNCGIINYLSA